eukprot:gene8637-11675_t
MPANSNAKVKGSSNNIAESNINQENSKSDDKLIVAIENLSDVLRKNNNEKSLDSTAKGLKSGNAFNAHVTRIMAEVVAKEDRARENFNNNSHNFRKSRNPYAGELTPRDEAELLIPIENPDQFRPPRYLKGSTSQFCSSFSSANVKSTISLKANSYDNNDNNNQTSNYSLLAHTSRISSSGVESINAMKKRRDQLDFELEQMKKVLEYKQFCLQRTNTFKSTGAAVLTSNNHLN